MQTVENYENLNGKLEENLQSVDEHELLSKLIEVSKSKDKPLVVKNNEQKNIGGLKNQKFQDVLMHAVTIMWET